MSSETIFRHDLIRKRLSSDLPSHFLDVECASETVKARMHIPGNTCLALSEFRLGPSIAFHKKAASLYTATVCRARVAFYIRIYAPCSRLSIRWSGRGSRRHSCPFDAHPPAATSLKQHIKR